MGTFNAERWRQWHRERGESYRWRKAVKAPDATRGEGPEGGWYFIEQDVQPEWRALVHTTTRNIESPEFGLIQAGATEFSVMPDEAFVGRRDEIILTERQYRGQTVLTRGDTEFDAIPNAPIASIVAVYDGGQAHDADDYELDADRIKWLANAPAEDARYTIEYRYQPTFTCLGASPDRMPRPSSSSVLMPLRVLLTEKVIGGD